MYLTYREDTSVTHVAIIVAKNDDYNGLSSLMAYTPSVSGAYYLYIRSYAADKSGTCDVYESVGGRPPVMIDGDVQFGGHLVDAHWKADETIEVSNGPGYFYIVHHNTMFRRSPFDAGPDRDRITPGFEGYGLIVVTAIHKGTESTISLCNWHQSFLDDLGRGREELEESENRDMMLNMMRSPAWTTFDIERQRLRRELEILPEAEREARVLALRDSILSAEDIGRLGAPAESRPPGRLSAAYRQYQRVLQANEKRLSGFDPAERTAEMVKIEREKRDIFRGLVPQEEE